jgi:indole-3-glycerol phosphate synthase
VPLPKRAIAAIRRAGSAPGLPKDCLLVADSGLYVTADLERMHRVGASIFLVGESLMRQADVTEATRALPGRHAPTVAAK